MNTSLVKVWVPRVDIGKLDLHEVLDHDVGGRDARSEQVRDDVDDLLVELGKSEHFLLHFVSTMLREKDEYLSTITLNNVQLLKLKKLRYTGNRI